MKRCNSRVPYFFLNTSFGHIVRKPDITSKHELLTLKTYIMNTQAHQLIFASHLDEFEIELLKGDRDELLYLKNEFRKLERLNYRIDSKMLEHIIDDMNLIISSSKDKNFKYNAYLLKMIFIKLDLIQTEITISMFSESPELYDALDGIKTHITFIKLQVDNQI